MKKNIGILAIMMFALSVNAGNMPTLSKDICRIMATHQDCQKRKIQDGEKVCAFVRLNDSKGERLLQQHHCEVVTRLGDILIVNIPVSELNELSQSDMINRIETHYGGRLNNDVTQEWINSTPLHNGTAPLIQAYDGQGVLLGISDIGLDVSHPTFLTADGSRSRVVRFLDQFAADDETYGEMTLLGREYSTPEDIAKKQHSADVDAAHGTHCLGIAAGSGFGSGFAGVAYGADLFPIASTSASPSFCSANEVANLKHIFDYAEEHHQPCVITYSVCFEVTEQDMQLFSEAFGMLTGPGRIIVEAAGNYNSYPSFVEKKAEQANAGATLLLKEKKGRVYLRSEGNFRLKCIRSVLSSNVGTQHEKGDSIVIDSDNVPSDSLYLGPYQIKIDKDGNFFTLNVNTSSSADVRLMMLIEDKEGEQADVIMYSSHINYFVEDLTNDGRFESAERSHNIGMPACLPNIITIGAINGRESYENYKGQTIVDYGRSTPLGTIANFSSVGPTLDGRVKPDAVAPGINIISSGNRFYTSDISRRTVATVTYNGHEYPWVVMSGTSMACPAAAGVVALWLQANPTLTPDDVKNVLAATCTPPELAMDYPNNTYGYGLIDAYAGMLHVLGIDTSIPTISKKQPSQLRIRHDENGAIKLLFEKSPNHPFNVSVFTIGGKCVAKKSFPANSSSYRMSLSSPQGIYIVQVDSDESGITGSELIRF